MKSALLLYPHQLFPLSELPQVDTVVMVEEPLFFGTDRDYPLNLHKQKLILHRASMRRYVEEVLWPAKLDVEYIGLDVLYDSSDILERVKKFDQLYIFDPVNDILTRRLLEARREKSHASELQFLPNPHFYLKEAEIRQYFNSSERSSESEHEFADFYQWQRERFNILIGEDYKPVGGHWMFENSTHESLPKDSALPSFEAFGDNKFVQEATQFVEEHFADNPGSTDFIWPTSHQEARQWLDDFVTHRLDNFGPYQDTINSQASWLYHSALSASLNNGLLAPQEVITAALKRHNKKEVPLHSLEAFIRQILGRREYTRTQYILHHNDLRTSNVFKHQRKLTDAWYNGELGIPPFDDMVKKVNQHAYAHSAERQAIAGNLMVIAEIHPDESYRWFSELFIDTYDWSILPSIYGLSHFAGMGTASTKPFISSSSHILQVSDYQHGVWSDIWDGLYWRFIDRHRDTFTKNAHTAALVKELDALDPDRRRVINYRAEDFLTRCTHIS